MKYKFKTNMKIQNYNKLHIGVLGGRFWTPNLIFDTPAIE